MGKPMCQTCGGAMRKSKVAKSSCALQLLGVILFLTGIVITILIPIIGWVVGPLLILAALFMGYSRSNVWKCKSCGAIVARA